MSRGPILLVEDNLLNRKLVVRLLSWHGFEVGEAGSVAEAEAWLDGNVPRLILMDVSLPGEDGLTFVRRLRTGGRVAVPIVAVTAHAMAGDCERALEAGCDAYLSKPLDLEALVSTVSQLCATGGGR